MRPIICFTDSVPFERKWGSTLSVKLSQLYYIFNCIMINKLEYFLLRTKFTSYIVQSAALEMAAILDVGGHCNTCFLKTTQHGRITFALFCPARNPLCTELGYQMSSIFQICDYNENTNYQHL